MEKVRRALNDSPAMRWAVLVLVGFVLSVNYYFYDAFSTLKDLLLKEFNFTNTDYGLFVSFYSIPNTFLLMAVIGGAILDRFGIRRTGFMFVFFMAFGALLTAYGASDYYSAGGPGYGLMASFLPNYSPELKMMLLGRFFFGLGAETSIVVVSKILVKWFKGKNLALAFGLKVGFGRLGTFAALQVSPVVAGGGPNLTTAVWLAAILVLSGLLAFMVYMLLDAKLDKQVALTTPTAAPEKFSFKDLGVILSNRPFIYIVLLCVTFYSAVFPFVSYAPDFFADKFGFTDVQSGRVTSLLPIGTAFFTPLFGFIIDRYGKSATAMILGSLIVLGVHLTFAYTMVSPYIPVIFLGIAFSLVPAAMWPSMVKLVKDSRIGTAYGIMYSVQNLGLWGIPLLAGIILDKTNPGNPLVADYTMTILMFAGLGLVGLLFSLLLKFEDKKKAFGIELPLNKK
ncbi:D-galactonate transporter [Salinivirga cyanobacteriivorans]|uniref:Lysosomal dipeptide transporter MFSD1 n=1 Tax=Salinivirga cyanobacteriivorans TaxID=1307839 RepID=A0A0S2HWW3_9BACT|nr:MFS transporter [Salinivirga cyanobacteriivorans]ALO14498.1 D-galactonate transporter [Salinivirga cyanobacteriivorans]